MNIFFLEKYLQDFFISLSCDIIDIIIFFFQENVNVVIVDWGVGVKYMNYMIVVFNI